MFDSIVIPAQLNESAIDAMREAVAGVQVRPATEVDEIATELLAALNRAGWRLIRTTSETL
jgi:hypothetical protein